MRRAFDALRGRGGGTVLPSPVKTVRRLTGWARRAAGRRDPRGLILLYHRIARPPIDPWNLCVSPENFAAHVAALQQYARVVPLTELLAATVSAPTERPPVAITFDDGYVDNLRVALPILTEAGVPATVFVTTGSLGSDQPFWWDRLAWIILRPVTLPEDLHLDQPDGAFRWRDGGLGGRRRLHRSLWTSLRMLEGETRDAALDRLARWSGSDADPLEAGRPLTPLEVAELGDNGVMSVGSHTVTHRPLPRLPLERQRQEILESLDTCARITGRRPATFSYPHGEADPAAIEIARESGLAVACAGNEALVSADSDPCALPRVSVHDWSGPLFSRWLRWYWLP